jgi:hypothetical protein
VYANSWTYITQACRGLGLGWKYRDQERLYSIGSHDGDYVVVNPLGVVDERLEAVLATLRRMSGRPVFVKKASHDCASALLKIGCVATSPGGCAWDDVAHADDDTYPELILDLDISLGYLQRPQEWYEQYRLARNGAGMADGESTKAGYRQFRRSVRRFADADRGREVVRYESGMSDAVESWVESYFGEARPEAPRVYDNLLAALRQGVRKGGDYGFVIQGAAGVEGLIFAERLDARSAGLYARLVRRSCPGLPEYAMSQALAFLRQDGIRRVNLGGSETLGLHLFKKKLAPVNERRIPLLVYGYRGEI